MLIDNLRLRGREGLWQLRVADGRIAALVPMEQAADDAGERLDGAGGLAVPPFIEPHIHSTPPRPPASRSGTAPARCSKASSAGPSARPCSATRTSSSAPGRP